MSAALDVEAIRKDFPILKTKMNGKPLVYLDSAATSQKPIQVLDAISDYYRTYNANIHRGSTRYPRRRPRSTSNQRRSWRAHRRARNTAR